MVKMIRLEWEKNNIGRYIRNAFIMTGILLLLFLSTAREMKIENASELYHKSILCIIIDLFSHMSYIVFASIMFASFIVSGYKNKTIYLMFSYPIKRQKILVAQMLSVWIFNVAALIITKLLAYGIFGFVSRFKDIDMRGINFDEFSFYYQIIISSILMISICFIALFVGIRMKSSKATVVSSVILVCLTQGNIGAFTLADNIVFYIILFILSIISIFVIIYKIDKVDI